MSENRAEPAERAAFVYMDAFRFIAAAAVALSHIRDLVLIDFGAVQSPSLLLKAFYFATGFGHQSVMVFFVLSGFWITGSVVRRAGDGRFWPDYLIDRLSRLLVVLIPALALGAICDLVGIHWLASPIYDGSSGAISLPDGVAESLTPLVAASNLLFLQGIAAPVLGSNGPLWSLAYEFWYYLWFPALWLLLARRRFSLALATFAIAAFNLQVLFSFIPWLCGTALFFAYRAACARGWIGRRGVGGAILLVGGVVFLGALTFSRFRTDLPNLSDIAVSASFALTLYGLCLLAPPRPQVIGFLAFYGAHASYSLYAIHYPVALLLAASLLSAARLPPGLEGVAIVGAVFVAVIAIGWVFAQLTERHTPQFRKRLRGFVRD